MGKVLIIKGADFSNIALDKLDLKPFEVNITRGYGIRKDNSIIENGGLGYTNKIPLNRITFPISIQQITGYAVFTFYDEKGGELFLYSPSTESIETGTKTYNNWHELPYYTQNARYVRICTSSELLNKIVFSEYPQADKAKQEYIEWNYGHVWKNESPEANGGFDYTNMFTFNKLSYPIKLTIYNGYEIICFYDKNKNLLGKTIANSNETEKVFSSSSDFGTIPSGTVYARLCTVKRVEHWNIALSE